MRNSPRILSSFAASSSRRWAKFSSYRQSNVTSQNFLEPMTSRACMTSQLCRRRAPNRNRNPFCPLLPVLLLKQKLFLIYVVVDHYYLVCYE